MSYDDHLSNRLEDQFNECDPGDCIGEDCEIFEECDLEAKDLYMTGICPACEEAPAVDSGLCQACIDDMNDETIFDHQVEAHQAAQAEIHNKGRR